MSISGVPTYPTVPKLQFSDVTDGIHQADTITMPRHKPLSRLSHNKLTTVIEHKPPTYQPIFVPLQGAIPSISVTETDEVIASDDAITSISDMPPHPPSSRTSTMCSAISARSHQEPGPIHISPSAQLQSMQSISELDARLNEVTSLHKPWGILRHNRTRSQETYTPTGTPESISNVPLSACLFEAHSRLNHNIFSDTVDGVDKHDWANSSEWVEPCATDDGSKEWVKDFLARQEQADRDEDSERQRQEKQDRRYGGIRGRVNSAGKFTRGLSIERVAGERGSFEARQERRNGGVFDLNIGSSPYRRATIPIPGEDLERPARARAFSWNPSTHQRPISQTALPNRSSWTPTSPSPRPHVTSSANRLHMSLPSRRSDVKRTFSTGFAPVITEGKDGIKSLVGRVEEVGESVTRKLSASWKGKWKGLGKKKKKKKSMKVGGMHIIGRER